MKNVFAVLMSCWLLMACSQAHQPINEDLVTVKEEILKVNTEFEAQTRKLLAQVDKNTDEANLQKSFLDLRATYKKMEWAVEYFLPHSARFINGPAIPEVEVEENTVMQPEGLQVLEELLFPYDPKNKAEVQRQLKLLLNKSGTIATNFKTISVNKSQVFDAVRQEVYRITSLGLSGFDTPISANHLKEMPIALTTVQEVLNLITDNKDNAALKKIQDKIKGATEQLKSNSNPATFNYADFLVNYLNPLASHLIDFKTAEQIADIGITRALNDNARSYFDEGAFNVDAFVPGENYKYSQEKAALGRALFNDVSLSRNNDRSCATCHHSDKVFSDGLAKSMSLGGTELPRNTPSLSYSAFQHGQFWDMRRADLESQSVDVITNVDEMHGDLKEITYKINQNTAYVKKFRNLYGAQNVEVWQLQNALASYIRSLAKFNSNFDEFMRGNPNALTQQQKEGFNLFVGKAKCATCHFIPLFNGTVPPNFSKTEQEVLGVAENFHNRKLDADLGKGKFSRGIASLQHSFKTPTVRNIEKTAPYMHNGGYQTLEQVMDFYNEGGGLGFGFKIDNQTLPEDKLELSSTEIQSIIAFMKSLNDK